MKNSKSTTAAAILKKKERKNVGSNYFVFLDHLPSTQWKNEVNCCCIKWNKVQRYNDTKIQRSTGYEE